MNETKEKGELVFYKAYDSGITIDVLVEDETVWLNRRQMSLLFDRDIKTIGKHINNALKEELAYTPDVENFATTAPVRTVAKFATVGTEGGRMVTRDVEYYNIDVILSVGYRVKSNRGIQFRAWANTVLKQYMLRGYAVSGRIDRLERKVLEHDQKLDLFIKTSLPPREGVFYDGQIFDAWVFVADLIRSAKKNITLLDNYADETALVLLAKRAKEVSVKIYTKHISKELEMDVAKHNKQYPLLEIHESGAFHDRFLIVDSVVYHIGASLKDLGKKLFAFSKMEVTSQELLKKMEK